MIAEIEKELDKANFASDKELSGAEEAAGTEAGKSLLKITAAATETSTNLQNGTTKGLLAL